MEEKRGQRQQKRKIIAIVLAIALILLWFADILPPKAAELVARHYLSNQQDGNHYVVSGSDYSPAHDCYFVYFFNVQTSQSRNIGLYYRYFPFFVFFDSEYPG